MLVGLASVTQAALWLKRSALKNGYIHAAHLDVCAINMMKLYCFLSVTSKGNFIGEHAEPGKKPMKQIYTPAGRRESPDDYVWTLQIDLDYEKGIVKWTLGDGDFGPQLNIYGKCEVLSWECALPKTPSLYMIYNTGAPNSSVEFVLRPPVLSSEELQ